MAKAPTKPASKTPQQAHTTTQEPSETGGALVPLTQGNTAVYDPALAAELANEAKDSAATERPSVSKLSLKGGILSYMGEACPDNEIEVVVLAHVLENTYYVDRYNPNVVVSPKCFALASPSASEDVAMTPHANVLEPQNDTCLGCPQNEWGSDPNGGRGKACKERRRLVVIPKPVGTIQEMRESEMAMLGLPVMSVKNWASYINTLAASSGLPYYAVVTRLKVVPDARSQFKVEFHGVAGLHPEYLAVAKSLREAAVNYGMTPYDPYQAPTAPPQSAGTGKQKFK